MKSLGRLATAAVALSFLHLVFGGIVRISGSGMGCGDHWPTCNGQWIPSLTNPHVMIELTHRVLALLIAVTFVALAFLAWRQRAEPGVSGPGGVLRPAITAAVLVVIVALLGAVTVKLGNPPLATVSHWTLAMTLMAVLLVTAVRAGALGGARTATEHGTPRAMRSLGAGAAIAFITVVLGGLVAKVPGAAFACGSFPLCGALPGSTAGGAGLQMTHRAFAYLLFFHVIAVAMAVGRRAGEAPVVQRTAKIAAGIVLLQLAIGAAMVLSALPPVLRSLHEATGIAVWIALFLAAYLARRAARAS